MPITLNGDTGITTPGLINTGSETVVNLTTSGNTILGDASTDTLNVASNTLVTDGLGKVGIGTASPGVKLQVTGANISGPTLGAAVGTFALTGSSTLYGLYAGVSANGDTWLQSQRNDAGTSTYNIVLNPSGGNVGLGVTPSAWGGNSKPLQAGDACFWGSTSLTGYSSIGGNYFYDSNYKYLKTAAATDYYQYLGAHVWRNAPSGTAGNTITFTDRMTLDASGNLTVAGNVQPNFLYINNATASTRTTDLARNPSDGSFNLATRNGVVGAASGTEIARLNWNYNGTDSAWISAERNSGTGANRINVVCNASAGVFLAAGGTSWGSLSDERQKTNLEPITDASNKLNTLRTVTGRYITDEETVSRAFLIAQDVQKVLPEAVDTQDDEEGTLGLRYTDLIPLLIAGFKEQQAMIDELKAKVAALEAA
jgi:hypothetical protein